MVKKKSTKSKKKPSQKKSKKKSSKKKSTKSNKVRSKYKSQFEKPKTENTLLISAERDIAMDFATKVYQKFDQMIKSIILFGSSAKKSSKPSSDIDIIIIIDDVSIKWDQELIAWYREELGKLVQENPYIKPLHINTVKLSTWWADLMKGDPIILDILRYGDPLIDFGGFFAPLKVLLKEGAIKPTPEAIYTLLQRAPNHLIRARQAMLAVIDGLYWTVVDSAHSALIAADIMPSSPEEISNILNETFVKNKTLDKRYIDYYEELHGVAKGIIHGKITSITGKEIDDWIEKTDAFLREMARLVDELIEKKKSEGEPN